MKALRVGIIGLGAIGSRIVEVLVREFSGVARVDSICDLRDERVRTVRKKWLPHAEVLPWMALVEKSDLIIEAASQTVAASVAEKALRSNKQVLILSVGGLLSWNGLSSVLKKTQGQLWIPSGALAGVDGLLAASQGKVRRVTLTTRKPVSGLVGAPYLEKKGVRLARIKKPTLIFEGSALEAIQAFPQNVNVAATLALAGIGPQKTRVRIFASPTYKRNQHEVEIEGDFGLIRTEMQNLPSRTNPKTSELAILSTVATLRKIFSRVRIGT